MAAANRKGRGRGSHGGSKNTGNPSSSALGFAKTRKVSLRNGMPRTRAVKKHKYGV